MNAKGETPSIQSFRIGRKERLDKLLVEKGMVPSRDRARALIMAGKVMVGEKMVDKPGTQVNINTRLQLRGEGSPYASRGGEKLEGALQTFGIDPKGMVVMDVGASTGGFTDCILQKGAQRVYAVDVGYGQLAWKLQQNSRVVNLERRNIRYLNREEIQGEADLILVDTSFISIEKFLPHLLKFLKRGGFILALIKPQFEVGKGEVGRGGVVRNPTLHQKVINRISTFSIRLGLKVLGVTESPLLGPKGNKEFFIYLKKENGEDG
ncbi:MAG: TlyA family RNA methyltransferase [Syntrophaceae bacterium]|nr:TlyA family RNA methyltransferase [Syntrophaceae bacterium]